MVVVVVVVVVTCGSGAWSGGGAGRWSAQQQQRMPMAARMLVPGAGRNGIPVGVKAAFRFARSGEFGAGGGGNSSGKR